MATQHSPRWIVLYAGVVTTLLVAAALARGTATPRTFDEITVHRINVVEPDGTLRMVISNRAALPGVIVQGREGKPDRPYAGMLFYNDEGTENGGLVFGGHRAADGRVVGSGGQLSFDKYGAATMVQLSGVSDSEDRFAGLRVRDTELGGPNTNRIWVGNSEDGTATVALMDQKGRQRLVLEVAADGATSLRFLDADGKVLQRLAPTGR